MKTCKKLLAITIALVLLVSTLVSGLVVSAAEVGTLVLTSQPITESDADQTVTVDLTFDYTEAVAAPHNLVTLSTDSTFVLESIVVTSVNGIAASEYDTETDPEGEVSANPCPIYIKENGINLSEGKFILEAITVDSNSIEDVVITATYTIPANTVAGKYPVTATADYTDYYECDDTLGITNCDIVIKAAHEHAAKDLVNNEDGTHTVKCECGETIETVKCVYENGECACGAEEPIKEPVLDSKISITANVAIKSTIAITYRISGATGYENFYLDITADRISSEEGFNKVLKSDKIQKSSMIAAGSLYAVQYSGIAMYELNVPLNATLYVTDAEGNVIAHSNTYTTTVKQLATTLYDTTKEAATKTIVSDLLNVGAEAQKYFAKSGSDLYEIEYPNVGFTGTPSSTFGTLTTTNSDEAAKNVTTAINLAVNPGIRYGFKNCSSATDLKVVFNYYDAVQKKNVVTEVAAEDMTPAGGVYYYRYQDITFYSGATTVTATVYDGNNVLYTHEYCLETILSKNVNTASMKSLVEAIAKFGKACQDYYL